MHRSVAQCRAELQLRNALHREDNLAHQRTLLRQQIARAMRLREDHTELSLQCRAIHAEWRQAVEEKLAAQQALLEASSDVVSERFATQELKNEPVPA
jgi:hypothetical protein